MSQLGVQEFRQAVDDMMAHHPQSPLDDEQRQTFTGLHYFPYNEELALEVEAERLPEDEPIVTMMTSTGDTQQYRRWGTFTFEVDGQPATATLYSGPHGHDFFLPFRDATSGQETYGAGRYMDDHRPALRRLAGNRFRVDFNYAYNPYCAYSEDYSCPLPPRENWLPVPIRAGEKDFK
jgi:uncharacterized protein